MKPQIRLTAATLVGALGLSLVAPVPAEAGREGRRNTAIALGAVAAYGVMKKKPLIAGLAGAGAIYSFMKSQEPERNRRRNRRFRRVQRRVVYRDRVVHRPGHYAAPARFSGRRNGWTRGMPPGQAKKYARYRGDNCDDD